MIRLEFESIDELKSHLLQSSDLTGAVFQDLELDQVTDELKAATLRDNLLIGCKIDPTFLQQFENPIVFPHLPGLPFKTYRASLYTPEELLGDYRIGEPDSYRQTVDGATYQHYCKHHKAENEDVAETLARRLHDHSITDALQEHIQGKQLVAIMGGHNMRRDDAMYLQVARLSRELIHEGFMPISGGGPGAMEATHLGAWFSARTDSELQNAISILSNAPLYSPIFPWLDAAFEVREKYPLELTTGRSLGIPTWLYGHEPPTCFATDIAKYFANSVREEGLLAIAKNGVIFAPGNEGTIQEIFQDAAQNRYETFEHASPMVFFGNQFWTQQKPVYPLLRTIASKRSYDQLISISDDRKEVIDRIVEFRSKQNRSD